MYWTGYEEPSVAGKLDLNKEYYYHSIRPSQPDYPAIRVGRIPGLKNRA